MAYVRKAHYTDLPKIFQQVSKRQIDYITTEQILADYLNNCLFVVVENAEIVGQCSLIYEKNYNYHALKRFLIYKPSCGYGTCLLSHFTTLNLKLGATPWVENTKMIKLLEKFGFSYQYTFLEKYCFFAK